MGHAISVHSKVKQARILLLGLDAAGKSTVLYKFKFKEPFCTIPTVGFNVEMIQTEKRLQLTIWDVGGQEKLRSLWCYYFENTDGLVYVVDSTNKETLDESKKEFQRILQNELIKNVPVVVLANKQDIPGALNADEITRKFNMNKYCSDRDWYVQPCCAISGQGLAEGFSKVSEFVKNSKEEALNFSKQSVRLKTSRKV
ncbi:PREDICTED: ADP-ribosylation factor-like protein 14 [Nanorana parkeri]|uniref:ADP-ribosylation factor-like protein 14 n=1 Tax=Nanorana parkeri TaxID=125878 RepID=UPI000853FD40|nr:PREDICTED: ADP-ribosylation factor-like protein 14 [Nanorana parkeri]